ncbi:MAG: diguanylate cyclase [Vicinamibacteria bacterium]|nr:diguanylate cyclase [Vicinamibacteria bacterium]
MLTFLATALLLAAKIEFVVPDANFSLREGLPAVQVLSLYQDSFGGLWAGTTAGLAQLGGPTIRVFGPELGLARSAVFAVSEEPSGAIVVGTSGGISRLVGDHFESVPLPPAAAQFAVRRFFRGRDGALWALAGERLLLRHFGGQWTAVGINDALAFEATDFVIDETGTVWLATRNHGLLRLTPVGTRFQKSGDFQAAPGAGVGIDHVVAWRDKIYFSSSLGVSVLPAAADGAVETLAFPRGATAGHRALAVTASGQVFVGTNAGVLTLESGTVVPVESRNERARSAAVTLLSDRESQLWVGTIESGLNLLLMGRGVRFLLADKESFRSIDVDKNGVHWISNGRRILSFRTDDQGRPVSTAEARFEGFDALTIYGIAEDPGGGLLFAMDAGVGLLPPASRAGGPLRVRQDPRFEILRDRLVTAVYRDKGDAVWAISPLGVYRVSKGATEAHSIPIPGGGNPWMGAMDAQGLLWVATRQGAMNVIDTVSERVTPVPLPSHRHVEFVAPAPDGGVVVTFENGASAFLFTSGSPSQTVTSVTLDGLSWLSVQSLQKMGETYLAAHEGDRLSQIRLNPTRIDRTILTSADLEDSDFRYLSLREGRAGQVWFALLNGIGLFDPPNAPPEPNRLRLVPDRLSFEIEPRPNILDLHAELSDPVAPRKARYRYRLVGQTDEWSLWSVDPHIPLANVPPGAYQLEVEAEDRYGRKSNPLSLDIVARAHPWESWPARLAALLLAASAAYTLYRRRVKAIEQDRLNLEAAVKAGRADLEIANHRLQELSLTDMLTGLRNRRYFSEVAEDEIGLLKRRFDERHSSGDPNRDAIFFLLDLDRFKTVNDLFGHAGGDAVLKETARRLQALIRKTDRLIRWGGEEFLVLSLDCQRSEAPEMAARMMAAISDLPFSVGPPDGVHITTSMGWAAYPLPIEGVEPLPEDVVRLADRGLYRAKRGGRNCAVGISPSAEEPLRGGARTGTVELLKDLGFSVVFTMVRGRTPAGGQDLATYRDSSSMRRPV